MREGRRLATCYHEAGHALARWYFGHDTNFAVVLTAADVRAGRWAKSDRGFSVEAEGFVDGYSIHKVPWKMDRIRSDPEHLRTEEFARDQSLIELFAGVIAEAVYRRVHGAACWLQGGSGDIKRIDRIADAWFGDDKAARGDALGIAERRAVALVRSKPGSLAIKAMADALMVRGEIDGDEIAAMCRSAYGGRETGFMEWDAHWPPSLADIRAGVIHEAETRTVA